MNNKDKNAAANVWFTLKGKLDSLLMMDKVKSNAENRAQCAQIDSLTHDERIEFIRTHYGEKYLNKAMPILTQMSSIEQNAK